MRSIIAVVAGFVVVIAVVMAGTAAATELIVPGGLFEAATGPREALPPEYFAANLIVSAMGAVLGGWVTARMAPDREMAHVFALTVLMILMSIPSLMGYGPSFDVQPAWYRYMLPILGVGGVLLGGWLRSRVVIEPEDSSSGSSADRRP
jgi:hypothetical protein